MVLRKAAIFSAGADFASPIRSFESGNVQQRQGPGQANRGENPHRRGGSGSATLIWNTTLKLAKTGKFLFLEMQT